MSFADYLRGAVGLTKATVGIDRADPATVAWRLHWCMACDELYNAPASTQFFHQFGPQACRQCGCFVKAKARIRREGCPLARW